MIRRITRAYESLLGRKANSKTSSEVDSGLVTRHLIEMLSKNIDKDFSGHGADVHSPERAQDWPSAYGLLASSCFALNATTTADGVNYRTIGLANTRWLISNRGCASTPAPCWGVPYARKIWEDIEPCRPGTAFAIPTCHSVQALDEAAGLLKDDNEARRHIAVAAEAVEYFATQCFDDLGDELVIWYSPLRQHSFHITNAIAMMAGQFQRMARHSDQGEMLRERADKAVQYLLDRKENDPTGPAWNYFGDRRPAGKANKRNDLLHDAFVCHGLLEYKLHDGRRGDEISYDDLLACLGRFYRQETFFDFPESETVKSRTRKRARAMGLGHGLYVASRIAEVTGTSNSLADSMVEHLKAEYVKDSDLFHTPGGDKISTFVRDVSHVIFGLTAYVKSQSKG